MASSMTVEGVEEILRGFAILPRSIQKKYLGGAVREAAKDELPELKSLTPRGPTGNLRRSVGLKVEKKKNNATAVGILGYRSRAGGNKAEQGFHAWWIENGVKVRKPKNASMLRVPMTMAKKYPYLMGKVALIGAEGGGAAYFPEVAAVPGTGKFGQWADRTLPRIRDELIQELGRAVVKAEAENARRDAKGK